MDLTERWSILGELIQCAETLPEMQVWLFGSALTSVAPGDLDVLIVYEDRADVDRLRDMEWWEVRIPPVNIIAMTSDEEQHYRFIAETGAIRLHPPTALTAG